MARYLLANSSLSQQRTELLPITHDAEISRLMADYRHGSKPIDTVDAAFAAIDAEPATRASSFRWSTGTMRWPRRARSAAGSIRRKPLYGVPFAVKDNIDVAGLPTTAGCPEYAYTPTASAPAVDRLIDAGAILIGKTNLDQFATGLVGARTPYPVPRNALDPALVPGGSSSGSAVAVARGLVSFALGTDTAGSGRVPAALNNIVGLKPSCGAISTRGVVPACRTLDCVSVFAGTVADAWSAFAVAAGYDRDDPWSRPLAGRPPDPAAVVRIGVPDDKSRVFGSDAAAAAFDAALALLPRDRAGPSRRSTWRRSSPPRRFSTRAHGSPNATRRSATSSRRGRMRCIRSPDRSSRARSRSRRRMRLPASTGSPNCKRATAGIWSDIDVLVVPSIPDVCTLADVEADPIGANSRLGTYTNFVNLLDLCALAVPGPFRGDGLPAGVTLIAPAGRDGLLAAIGAAMHRAAGVTIGANGFKVPAIAAQPAEAPPACDRARRGRRASVRHGAQPRIDVARRRLRPQGDDRTDLSPVRPARRAAHRARA